MRNIIDECGEQLSELSKSDLIDSESEMAVTGPVTLTKQPHVVEDSSRISQARHFDNDPAPPKH